MNDHSDIPHTIKALEYAQQVVERDIVACKYTRLACQRFLDDLDNDNAAWHYDAYEAERACDFIETLPHIKGIWAKRRELLVLQPWQCFIVCATFGFRCASDVVDEMGEVVLSANTRRFRTVYIEVARKNAKSTLAAAIGLYMLTEDHEAGAEVYSNATTRKQAKIVFSIAQAMARKTPQLPVEVRAHNINYMEESSLFEALHAQGETLDGYNIHCALNDELHAWQNRNVYNVIETATGARLQPLMFNITTAGKQTDGICYDLRQYLISILESKVDDDSFFGVIYTLDADDEWTDRSNWIKANPNWNVSVYPIDMERLAKKAAEVPSEQNAFLNKRLNVWTSAAVAWMNMQKWEACHDPDMRIEDFQGEDTWIGIDLASKIDLASQAQLFSREINGEQHIYAFMRHWLPEHAIEEDPNGIYDGWARAGHIRTTPGNVIDVDRIEDDTMMEAVAPFRLRELAVDPMHNSTQFGVHMAQQGLLVVDVRPTVANFSEAMKWLEAFVKDGRFHHNCPVLTWMISNVEVKQDFKDNIYPRKSGPKRKIDGVIAVLMGLNRVMAGAATYYPGEGVVII